MIDRLEAVRAVAMLAILDALRRKDLYVMAILCAVMIAAGRLFALVGVWGLETFIKDVTFKSVSLCSVVLAILLAARQVPEEISRRTLYPLLARPIGRVELLLGKFLGTLVMAWVALLLAGSVAILSLLSLGYSMGPVAFQFMLLRALSLAPIVSLSLCLSLYLTPAAAVLVSALLIMGSSTFARASDLFVGGAGAPARAGLHVLDWTLPRLDLFDLGKKVAFGWPAIPGWVLGALAIYALVHTVLPFSIAAVRFRRMAL